MHHEIPSALIWRNQPHRSDRGQELKQVTPVTLAYANPDIAKFVTRGVPYDRSGTSIQGRIAKRHQAFSLEKLPSNMRRVMQMTLDGLTVAQMAAQLDTSENNIHQLRSRGMKKLKEVLGDGLD